VTIRMRQVAMTINGRETGTVEVPEDLTLLEFLHEYLNLTGTRYGCGQGACNACSVLLDRPDGTSIEIAACVTGVLFANGKRIRTVEGLAKRAEDGALQALSPVQQAYLERFSFQCSYCTPGFLIGATALIERLERRPVPRERVEAVVLEALDRHICRCTGYVRYLTAVRDLILSTPGLTTTETAATVRR
jgi:aerobic-type carbon monoxide dehydrogenase small subunit (CoxS/CutS family)